MKTAVEHIFTGTVSSGTYDPDVTMVGSLFRQFTGAGSTDKYIGLNPPTLVNMVEVTGFSFYLPHVHKWSDNIYWIFAPTNAAAAVTRNIGLFEYDKAANSITWKGYITLSGTTIAGAKILRALLAHVYTHDDGTVSTSGSSTTITGVSTLFQSDRIAVGARIGFGTTDVTAVSTWYEITAINSETDITISAPVTLAGGTAYVIEEIRICTAATNATLYNGGLHIIKGLNYGTFQPGGTVIAESTTVDNIRASYLCKDKQSSTFTVTIAVPGVITLNSHGYIAGDIVAFTTTGALPTGLVANTNYFVTATSLAANTFTVSATLGGAAITTTGSQSGTHTCHSSNLSIAMGLGSDDFVSNTSHDIYFLNLDNATSVRVHRFNMRAALTTVAGISTGAWTYRTAVQITVGTGQQTGNGRIFSVAHGSASGVKSLYFVTATRVYRCAVSALTDLGSAWLSDFMLENPPGTVNTNLATNAMNQVDYVSSIDRLFISTTLAGRHGVYVAKYDTASGQFEKIFGQISNRTKLTTTDAGAVDAFFNSSSLSVWSEDGILFAMPSVVTTGLNWFGVLPAGADGYYSDTSGQHVITPKMATVNATRLYRCYVQTNHYTGTFNLGYTPEPIRVYYRTSGIDDNSGAWTETISGDLSGAVAGTHIQFKLEFEVLGELCVPRRVYAVSCTFEDNTSISNYLPSADLSNKATKTFAWKFRTAFGGTVPTLRIQLYNAITGSLLDDDDSVTQSGTWEKTTDGTTWAAYNSTDKANETTFIRFTPSSIPDNIQVRAVITLL